MGVTFERFQELANSTSFGLRDITLDAHTNSAKLGKFFFSAGKNANIATMKAFREALSQKFGVFGEHAFDTILGRRQQMQKSLRACDIKAVITKIVPFKEKRFINELERQLDTDPKFRELSRGMQEEIRRIIKKSPFNDVNLKSCNTVADISRMAARRLASALEVAESSVTLGKEIDASPRTLDVNTAGTLPIASNEPTGLKNCSIIFGKQETSVADKVKKGTLGVGMRINRSDTNPVLLNKLKTNGVEPGFIYKNDWSLDDTKSLMADFTTEESRQILEDLKEHCPKLKQDCANLPLREQIMLCGRMHPACMSAVADYVLEKNMENKDSAIYRAFCEKYPDLPPENWRAPTHSSLKKNLFVEIRDAVMGVKKGDSLFTASPIFKHFSDRHIVKLDYNESERIIVKKAGSAGKFMRPERIKIGRKMGQLYRLQTATTANKSSAGAVTEALANDLTRLAGVPSQELSIVRGQYSDGHPKLMLEAKFADGYTDMENGFIKDGQIVPPNGEKVENLGRYKAFFLVTADRDGVGSRGQNKGFITGEKEKPGTFFAIDPGHSLEGNGRFLEVDDNFSFKDTYGFSTKPRFKNFSVFDDDTRFAKFQGALDLRALSKTGKIEKLFQDYRAAFTVDDPTLSPQEKELRVQIMADIDKKEAEWKDSLAKILNVAENQFRLYDDLASDGPQIQEKAIETLENLEKLTSPTTWVSPKGEVPLHHLSVIPETRVPWRAHVDGDDIIYHCDQPLSEEAQTRLKTLAHTAGAKCEIDAEGCARLIIARTAADRQCNVFSEQNVAKLTHTEEALARAMGEKGLIEARTFAEKNKHPSSTASVSSSGNPAPPAAFDLPERLEIRVGHDVLLFRKQQLEAMLANTPPAERPKNLSELQDRIATRIQKGRDIITEVMTGNGHRYAATPRNVACVTLAFHAATLKKGEYNERGSFSVADPEGKLYQWLDTCKELYLRTSTHAKAYHHMTVDGHMNMPRGLDVPEGMGGLMGGMRTLHYLTIPEQANQPRRLFLKCETYGIYRSTISKNDEEASRVPGMQTRQKRTGDTRESIKHCLSLATVITRLGKTEGNRKENIPSVIKDAVSAAQKVLRGAGLGNLAEMLGRNIAGGGIRLLLDNLIQILNIAPKNATALTVAGKLIDAVADYAENITGEAANRMGYEVMLDEEELV